MSENDRRYMLDIINAMHERIERRMFIVLIAQAAAIVLVTVVGVLR